MSHLPGIFLHELIATLFHELDEERAFKVLKKYHNKNLRMDTKDSASLKSFVGLNDAQYVRLMRSLYYFAGLRILAPMKAIYRLRKINIKQDYSTLISRVVDMVRKFKKGPTEVHRVIKVLVSTIRPFECILTFMSSTLENGKFLE